jgi:uncharacterized protein (UPF0264 family)
MKNIRSISIAALSLMVLLSTTASHGMGIVNAFKEQGTNLVTAAKTHPYISAAIAASPFVGFGLYKAVQYALAKKVEKEMVLTIKKEAKQIYMIASGLYNDMKLSKSNFMDVRKVISLLKSYIPFVDLIVQLRESEIKISAFNFANALSKWLFSSKVDFAVVTIAFNELESIKS